MDGTPVPKRVEVVIIVMNCILFGAFVDVSIDRKICTVWLIQNSIVHVQCLYFTNMH